jgi:superfamily II DNA helicase RecQ
MQFCGEPIPQNRIFAQYHKDYPNTMKQLIVSELVKESSNLRLVLATVALGMDLNAPYIQRIIHCRPPTTMEKMYARNRTSWTKWPRSRSHNVFQHE